MKKAKKMPPSYKIPKDIHLRPTIAHHKKAVIYINGLFVRITLGNEDFTLYTPDLAADRALKKRFHNKPVRLRLELEEFE